MLRRRGLSPSLAGRLLGTTGLLRTLSLRIRSTQEVMRTPGRAPAPMKQRMQRRRRLTHIQRLERLQRLEKRLADEAKRLHEQADLLPPGPLRKQVLMKARQAETGSHVSELLRSPGLRSPDQKQNWIPHILLV